MPQDDLKKKKPTVQERNKIMRQSIISRVGNGIAEGANEMIQNAVQKKIENKIKRPDTPLAATPEPKMY